MKANMFLAALWLFDSVEAVSPAPRNTVSYEGYINIMLVGVTLMVALLAVILAILAFFGYRSLADEVIKRAEGAAEKVALDRVEQRAVTTATEVAEKWLERFDLGVLLSAAQSEPRETASNQTEPVGEAYPGQEDENGYRDGENHARTDHPGAPEDGPR